MARGTTRKATSKRAGKTASGTKRKGAAKTKSAPKRGPVKGARPKAVRNKAVLAHPGTAAMIDRINACNKPPICWQRLADGSYLECYLRADCTYGNCVPVDPSQVPPGAEGC